MMPVKVYWIVKHRVAYLQASGDVTLDEVRQTADVSLAMMHASHDAVLVHAIQDGESLKSFPRQIFEISKITRELRAHPQLGYTVVVSLSDPLIEFISIMVTKIARSRRHTLHTLAQGLAFLNQVDSSLPDLSAIPREAYELVADIDSSRVYAREYEPLP